MSDLDVRSVTTEAEKQAFLRMPWTVYKDDPAWVAPLWREHIHYFDPAHNAELQHIDMEKFVAWRGETPVGTIIAFINHNYNEFQEENAGWFGQFELLEDEEAAHALLKTAEDWVRAKGADKLMGPATYSTNSEIGLLIDGYEHPPMVMTSHACPYYKQFVDSYGGFEKAQDLWCWYFDGEGWGGRKADNLPEKLTRVINKLRKRRNFEMVPLSDVPWEEAVKKVKLIYNQAWAQNWGFIPLTEAEMDQLEEEFKPIIDRDVAFFVEVEGKTVAFAAPLPNIYEPLQKVNAKPGEPAWWQLLKLLWHWKVAGGIGSIRVFLLGILEEYRGTGIDGLLYYDLLKAGLPRGYLDVEMSWILESNDMMNRGIQVLGGEVYKTYRVYEKQFS